MNAQNLFDTYFENIRIIYSLFFSNSKFSLELYGDSFNSSSPHLGYESDCELVCSSPSCHALFVHRQSVVVAEDKSLSLDVDGDRLLKFVCKNIGPAINGDSAAYLSPTSDTCAFLESGSFGLSGKVLMTDNGEMGRYFLSGDLPTCSFPRRVLFCYSPVIELLESESSADFVFDHRAVETTVAIASESWPDAAQSWMGRCHPWISCDVLNIVASSPVYFVPKGISQCCVDAKSQKHLLWKSEFIAAEDVLMKSLSVEIKIAYQLLLELVIKWHLSCCCVSHELLIKHALFWCLDEMSVSDDWNEKSIVEYYVHTLKKLHLFLSRRHFPHYFMPNVNILCSCDCSVCDISWMEAAFTDLTAIQWKAEVIQQTLTCTGSDVICSISRHLKALFAYSVSMSFIQLFHYLHADTVVDHLIAQHHDVLNHLHCTSLASHHLFLKPLLACINSSLGTLYLVKAYTASSGQCWTKYREKAEHCMLEAVAGNNMPSCTLYLIQFLLQMKCYREAKSYMEVLLAISSQNLIENNVDGITAFSDELLAIWCHTSWHIDVMFSPVEATVLLPQLESSLSFAYCNKIGYSDSPVAVLKLEFWMLYVGALCYAHGDNARALTLLADAERHLADSIPQPVGGSDRAHITYFYVLAGTLVKTFCQNC